MIRILYLLTKDDVGGAQKYVRDLSSRVDKNRFSTHILYGGKDLRWLSNRIYPLLLFANDWLAIIEIYKALKRERPRILHLNSSKAGVVGSFAAYLYNLFHAKKVHPVRVVFTAHGWVFSPTNSLSTLQRYAYTWLHRLAALGEDKIICVSAYDHALATQARIAPKKKLITIHNGIDPDMPFLSREKAREEILDKAQLENGNTLVDHPWIGSVGRLTKEKDYGALVQAAALVPHAHFFIIGDGPEKENLQSQISDHKMEDRFFIIPPTGEDAKYLKAFDIFTLTSVKEGLPYALLEALAAGLPAVVTDVGGMPEAVQPASGLVVPRENPVFFSEAIKKLATKEQERKPVRVAAERTLSEEFSFTTMRGKTEAVYDASLSGA